MGRRSKYSQEFRERAVRLVAEQRDEYPSEFETIRSVAAKLGIGSAETLRKWVRRHPSHHRNGDTLNLCNSGRRSQITEPQPV